MSGFDPKTTGRRATTASEAPEGGSLESLRELFDRFADRVYRLLYCLSHDASLAEDLTQETFLRIHRTGSRFRGEGSLEGWVMRIAANLFREVARTGSSRSEIFRRAVGERRLAQRQPAPRDPEQQFLVRQLLKQLEVEDRTILVLALVEGYTHKEIGEILGIPEGTSKAKLFEARRLARRILENEGVLRWKKRTGSTD